MTGLSGAQSVLCLRYQLVEYRCLVVPPSGVLWHPKWIWWHAPRLIQGIWQWYVCGMGIYINQVMFNPELINPVSLKQIMGKTFEPVTLAKELCKDIDKRMTQLFLYKCWL